jgi:hypothetical protein
MVQKEFEKKKKQIKKEKEKNKKNWGINIWTRACVRSSCWPPSDENAKAIHTHTHTYLQYIDTTGWKDIYSSL